MTESNIDHLITAVAWVICIVAFIYFLDKGTGND